MILAQCITTKRSRKMPFSMYGTPGIWILTNCLASSITLWFAVTISFNLVYSNLLNYLSTYVERCPWPWSKSRGHLFWGHLDQSTWLENRNGLCRGKKKKAHAPFIIQLKGQISWALFSQIHISDLYTHIHTFPQSTQIHFLCYHLYHFIKIALLILE